MSMILKTLRKIVQEISHAPNLKSAFNTLVMEVRHALKAQACAIFLLDEEHAEYILIAADGLSPEVIGRIKIRADQGLVGLVGQREEPINLADAPAHPRFLNFPEAGEGRYRGFLGVPIISQRKVLGVLFVEREQRGCFDEEEEELLITLSIQLADIIALAEAKGFTALKICAVDTQNITSDELVLNGIACSPGIGMGQGVVVYPPADLHAVPDRHPQDIQREIENFKQALAHVCEDVKASQHRLKDVLAAAEHTLFDAYIHMLNDPALADEVMAEIHHGNWAQGALKTVILRHMQHFEVMDDDYLRERATDIKDLGIRLLAQLQKNQSISYNYPENTILIGEEITFSTLTHVPPERLRGIVAFSGSNNAHVAILARALGVPTVLGAAGGQARQLDGKAVIVDGYSGQVFINPQPELKARLQTLFADDRKLDTELAKLAGHPATTIDGYTLELCVNTGFGVDGGRLLRAGADGVGLYRTEEPFMLRERFPAEEEQRLIYRQLLTAFAPKSVIMRTLDIGGDKTLAYFPFEENNPALGWRGIRITLDHPEIFLVQLRALLKASVGLNNLKIMFPMVSGVTELVEAKSLFLQAYREVLDEGLDIKKPEIGIMIEIPSAVYQARELAKRVNFLSVGSNDLIQYLLAVDRTNPRVANLYDGFHPAVLQALKDVVTAGHAEGKKVCICGEMAADPVAVIALLGLGFDSLSMNASALNRVKWMVRNFKKIEAEQLVEEILSMDNPSVIRFCLEQALERNGLDELVRSSKKVRSG